MFLPENAATFENKEVVGNWSGNSYVVIHLREDPPGMLGRAMIANRGHCGHVNRICVDCFDIWQYDHLLIWDRTAGGRGLLARLIRMGRIDGGQS